MQTAKSWRPSSVAVVSQTWLPHRTGEDQALPWIGGFHLTWLVSDQARGRPVVWAIPSPRGPRNWGQLSVDGRDMRQAQNSANSIRIPLWGGGTSRYERE